MIGSMFPGQQVDPSDYVELSYNGIPAPEGLLECNGMVGGFVSDRPEGIDSHGRELYPAFGMDAEGGCHYLGLTPLDMAGCDASDTEDLHPSLEEMRIEWILRGGSDPLDTRDSLNFLAEYGSRFGFPSDDYGALLAMIPGESMVDVITEGLPQEDWDPDTAMLMHDRSAILRYRRHR